MMLGRRQFLAAGAATIATAAAVAFTYSNVAHSAEAVFTGGGDAAINGYDPVAYFTEGKPVKGSADHTAEYKGATWQFASADNRDLFAANPEKYAPQYGGYCAFAAANNQLAKTEPEAFSIVDDKLYLNYDLPIRERWENKKTEFIAEANRLWPSLEPK